MATQVAKLENKRSDLENVFLKIGFDLGIGMIRDLKPDAK